MQINKILLLVPPALTFKSPRDINPLPPMGLGYLASIIVTMGIEVDILDCLMEGWDHEEKYNETLIRVGLSDAEIINKIQQYNPDIVGVNCQFSRQHRIYHHMFSLIKQAKPSCITVAGGAHATACPEDIANDSCCDYALLGEAEDSFREFLMKLIKNEDLSNLDGFVWKPNGRVRINEKRKWITDLDAIPFPAYSIMKLEKYFGHKLSHGIRHKSRFSPIITSRGCPAKCTFCSAHKVWGVKYRQRSVENVLAEMRMLKNQYKVEELMFEDDNVTANPKRARDLFLRMIDEKLDFVWDTPNGVGVWSINEEILDLMKISGCQKLNFPVESGSQGVLNNVIKKPLKLEKVKELIQYCRKIDLDYGMFLVIGMPGEKISDIWDSFCFAASCGCYSPHISVATPYPSTELYDVCKEGGYFSREYNLDDLFIRSFPIKTADWDERDLKRILARGMIYLEIKKFVDNPFLAIRSMITRLKHPLRAIKYLKNM